MGTTCMLPINETDLTSVVPFNPKEWQQIRNSALITLKFIKHFVTKDKKYTIRVSRLFLDVNNRLILERNLTLQKENQSEYEYFYHPLFSDETNLNEKQIFWPLGCLLIVIVGKCSNLELLRVYEKYYRKPTFIDFRNKRDYSIVLKRRRSLWTGLFDAWLQGRI